MDAAGSYRLTSAPATADSTYSLRYDLDGTEYTQDYELTPGDNTLYHTVGDAARAFQVTRVPSLMTVESVAYDEMGNITTITDVAGDAISSEYDLLNRPTKVTYPSGETVEFTYDAASNVTSMHDSTGWQFYTHDDLSRLLTVTFSDDETTGNADDRVVSYTYSLADELTRVVYPSGKTIDYTYDAPSRLRTVIETEGAASLTTTYEYHPTTGAAKLGHATQ